MVWGPRGQRRLRLVIDTGAAETMIIPEALDDLGYSPRQGEAITVTRSAVGKERGYLIRVARFRALGFEFADFRVNALGNSRGSFGRGPHPRRARLTQLSLRRQRP